MFKPKTYTKTINGNTYTAQFNGLQASLDAFDECSLDNNRVSISKMAQYVLKNVIVEPKLSVNDFSSLDDLNAVVAFGTEVMKGTFRPEE